MRVSKVSKASPDQGSMWFARMNDVECSVVTIVPKTVKVDKKGNLKVEMQPKGGLIVNE